jgi:dienelactone hydrolase
VPGTLSTVTRIALLIVFATLAACKSATQRPASVLPPPPAAVSSANETSADIAGGWISVSVALPQTGDGPFPVVISPIVADEQLLERGIAVARFHTNWESLRALSDRGAMARVAAPMPSPTAAAAPTTRQVGNWLLAAPRPGIVGRAYFDIISVDAAAVPKVVDHLSSLSAIDASRIAITGSSTGGFIALQAMAGEPRIAVGAVRVACGDYMTFLKSSSLALDDDPRWLENGKVVLDPDYAVEIATREPIRHADRYPPRPLLLLAGEQDRAIPFACVENTVQRFVAAYAEAGVPERFRFSAFAGEGHNLSDDANGEILPWLERWLAAGVSGRAR